MTRLFHLTIAVFMFAGATFAQTVQTVQGRVVEKNTQEPLQGVNIIITDADGKQRGGTTNANGVFMLTGIPVGRCHVVATMIGYAPFAANNIMVYSGNETKLDIVMDELITALDELTITPKVDKNHALNKMASVSARMLSSEEANRYAGAWGDPARMASNLAGVAAANDNRNDIIIRGNSPSGLLWRLDGFDIPNPNHYGSMGGAGGTIGMLNNNQLTNSDFYTGAFPAEFGNVTSGVFDLKMRNGNSNKHEFLAAMGFNGLELAAEGPLSRNAGASYMVNGRYSFLDAFKSTDLADFMPGIPKYEDLCAKVNIPLRRGNLSLITLLGSSEINTVSDFEDASEGWREGDKGMDVLMQNKQSFVGVNYTARFSASTRLENRLSYQRFTSEMNVYRMLYPDDKTQEQQLDGENSEGRIAWTSALHHRLDSRNFLMAGVGADFFMTFLKDVYYDSDQTPQPFHDADENSTLIKGFVQWQYRFSDRFSITPGFYAQLFTFTNDVSLEPRIGMRWTLTERSSLSLGTGLHSQLQPRLAVFYKDDDGNFPNDRLGASRSWQTVAGYDLRITDGMRLKTELYYQHLYNIPVIPDVPQESILNLGDDYYNDWEYAFVNRGKGRNYGIELTLEKFFDRNYYFLLTGSLYDAKYTGYDGIERRSRFAGNFSLNALAGYEWKLSKNRLLSINTKTSFMGAKRYTPVTIDHAGGDAVFDYTRAYTQRLPVYFRCDLNVNIKQNFKRVSLEWFLEAVNVTNRKNVWQKTYNAGRKKYEYVYQHVLMPIGGFKLFF